ncbi:shikimate kinase [Microbacterium sp. 22303]|uniref:shikimate kinase n=1 Tax=Microbacterium sp. 22303 TaxID=3453905 RepID=UPI003F84C6F7
MNSAEPAIVLIGPMGSGKTSIGRRVAKATGLHFVDTDKVIVREHGPIPAIFAEHGETQFRTWEREAVAEAIAGGGVISLGGGAVIAPETRALLQGVPVVLLTVSPEAVAARIAGDARPLLQGEEDPVQRWTRIFAERRALYEEVADVHFDTSRVPMSRVAEQVVEWMRGRA